MSVLSVSFLLPFSHAAVVSFNPRQTLPAGITFNAGVAGGIVGSLTPLNSPMLVNKFVEFATNGTLYFNVTGLELGEPSRQFSFTRTGYGNGTMTVTVVTSISPNILGIFQKVAYSNNLLVLTFTDGSSSGYSTQLQIVWGGLSSNLLTAAVFGALVLGPFLILIAIWKSGAFFQSVQSRRFNPTVENREATKVPWAAILILVAILATALLALGIYRGL